MTAQDDPRDRLYDLDAALSTAAEGVAQSICGAVAADLSEARLDPLVRAAMKANGIGIEAVRAAIRKARSSLAAAPSARAVGC
jgi:hypothetical protein